jgi:hypothetical protein
MIEERAVIEKMLVHIRRDAQQLLREPARWADVFKDIEAA